MRDLPTEEMCHCGEPLHYLTPTTRGIVQKIIDEMGPNITVEAYGRRYSIPRHYIALHGIRADELHLLGFKEVTDGR